MSKIVDTQVGRFRQVSDGDKKWFLWECPKCKSWAGMSDEQWDGKVSVVCSGPQGGGCRYHETHEFGKELYVATAALHLMGYGPHDEGQDRYGNPLRGGGADGYVGD